MTADPLAPLDLAFWNLESAGHPMHLAALGVFTAGSPSAAAHAADLLAARSAAVPGLRMRIRDTWRPPGLRRSLSALRRPWPAPGEPLTAALGRPLTSAVRQSFAIGGAARDPDPGFDPLHHVRLHEPVADFHATAGELMGRPLERTRPPWEAHVLPEEGGARFAVLFKFHHALADGLRALTLAAALMDPMDLPAPRPRPAEPPRGVVPDVREVPGMVREALAEAGRALDIGAAVARSTLDMRSSPALTCAPSGTRRTAGVVVDLDDVHRIRKSAGGTVNDVLIAVVAGALRRWLDERGDGSADVAPRALVPVSRRRPRTAHPQGNQLSGYLIRLPVDEKDPRTRLTRVRTAMDRNKEAGPHRGAGAVALLAEHVPPLGHRLGGPLLGQAARLWFDLLVTSVPLPGFGLRLGGDPLGAVFPLAPLAPGHSLAVAVSTYRGRVHYGLVADGAAVEDLDLLARAVTEEVTALTVACAH